MREYYKKSYVNTLDNLEEMEDDLRGKNAKVVFFN